MKTLIISLYLLFVVGMCYCQIDKGYPCETYSRAIQSDNTLIHQRVICLTGRASPPSCRSMFVDYFFSNKVRIEDLPVVFYYIDRSDGGLLGELINKYDNCKTNLENLLVGLVNKGANTEGVKEFILKQLMTASLSERQELYLKTALACTNYSSQDNMNRIEILYKKLDRENELYIFYMALLDNTKWITEPILCDLRNYVNEPSQTELSMCSAMILSKTEDGDSLEIIRKASRCACNEDRPLPEILYDFCLARLSFSENKDKIYKGLSYLGEDGFANHTDYSVWFKTRFVCNEPMKKHIMDGLNSEDPNIVAGVLFYCGMLLPESVSYRIRMLELLEKAKEEIVRSNAARALSTIAENQDVEVLRRLAEKERSESVQEEIGRTIEIVSMKYEEN